MTHVAEAPPGMIATPQPQQAAAAVINQLHEDFDLLDDWTARYQYLIDLGKQLPDLPEGWRKPEYLLQGCQSQVWFVVVPQQGLMHLLATSDSAIVSGLIRLLQIVYSGRTAAEILAISTDFLRTLGLDAHLSPTRRNGLAAMVSALRAIAAEQREAA